MQAIERIRKNLAALIAERGTTEAALSKKATLGHTGVRDILTGKSQNPTHRTLTKIAAALEVDVGQITGEAVATVPLRNMADVAGLAEGAVPYEFTARAPKSGSNQGLLQAIFGGDLSNPATYRVTSHQPAFGYLAGDILVADLSRLPLTGEVCLVTIADDDTAAAATEIMRYLPPHLLPGDPSRPDQIRRVDAPGVIVRHPVVGMLRGIAQ